MTFKQKNLALFQFISFLAIIVFAVGTVVLGYEMMKNNLAGFWELKPWLTSLGDALVFNSLSPNAVVAGIFFYSSLGLALISWIFGWNLFRMKERNLYDSLFLLFIMIPVLSNIFALIAQLNTKKILFTSTKIDKQKIIDEETKEIQMKHRKNKAKK